MKNVLKDNCPLNYVEVFNINTQQHSTNSLLQGMTSNIDNI